MEGISTGLPSQGNSNSPGQQQSRAATDSPHKATVPIAAIAGAAAGGLVAVLIGKSNFSLKLRDGARGMQFFMASLLDEKQPHSM